MEERLLNAHIYLNKHSLHHIQSEKYLCYVLFSASYV